MKLSARDTTFPNSCIAGTVVLPRSIKFRIVKSDIPAWQRSMNGMLDWEQLVGMAMVKRWQMLCESTNWRSKHSSEMASYYAQHVSLSLIIRLSFVWFSLVAYGRLLLKSWIIIPCYAGGTFSGTIDVYLTKSARYGRKLSLWVGLNQDLHLFDQCGEWLPIVEPYSTECNCGWLDFFQLHIKSDR